MAPYERRKREHPYFETTCLSIIFVGKLVLKRTALYGMAKSSSFILLVESEEDGSNAEREREEAHGFVFYNKVTRLGNSFPGRYHAITISAIGDVALRC